MIINLTKENTTSAQEAEGVVDPESKDIVKELLTFNYIPTQSDMAHRAMQLGDIALSACADKAMIKGPAYFLSVLERMLNELGVDPVYAFERKGLHCGFVEVKK